jgi:hypothetical protein
MKQEDFSLTISISKDDKFYKNFNLPLRTRDIIYADVFEGTYIASQDRASTDTNTIQSTISPFRIQILTTSTINAVIEAEHFPTLYPSVKSE